MKCRSLSWPERALVPWLTVAFATVAPEALAQPAPGENAPPPAAPPGSADEPAPVPSAATPDTATPEPAAPEPAPEPAPAPELAAPPPSTTQANETPVITTPTSADSGTEANEQSWFYRTPLAVTYGQGDDRLSLTLYGFLQTDALYDTTRSYNDSIGTTLVARTDTYDGTVGRMQFSARNTRIGLAFDAPLMDGARTGAVFEGDFFGNQPSGATESDYFDSPTFRLRHAYVSVENEIVDVLVGQTYDVFGWQNYFFPTTAEFIGLPHQVFSRHAQVRLLKEFAKESAVGVDLAVAALRPAQRDSGMPDFNGGLRVKLNDFKGLRTSGNGSTAALPLAVGVSGVVRKYKVDAFAPPPTQDSNEVTAWGLSVDALLPILAADTADDRGNRLTLTGSYVMGTGIGDLLTTTGGATFPTLPNPAQANPPPEYDGNIDPGLVSFDTQGVLHTIDWQAFRVGFVWYLPPTGRLILSGNYTQAYSENMRDLFPQGGAEIELLTRVADRSRYADLNLFFDASPRVRLGIAGAYTEVEYIDGDKPHNYRGHAQVMYFF